MYKNVYNDHKHKFGYITDRKHCDCGNGFEIESISKCIEDNTIQETLLSTYINSPIRACIPRGELDKQHLQKLRDLGFDVFSTNADIFTKALQNAEEDYGKHNKLQYHHKHIGWQLTELNDRPLYKSYGYIGQYKSEYRGVFNIKPSGKCEEQIAMIKKEVIGNIPLEAVLALSASAIVNGFIGERVKTPTIIAHLFNDSTTGKTTAGELAVSLFGSPSQKSSGLLMSWDATFNALAARLQGNYGMLACFDELSRCGEKDLSTLIYKLGDGRDKDRLQKDAKLREISLWDSWHTTLLSTAEESLIARCKKLNTGIKVRVLELNDIFTTSAQNAQNIKASVSQHYGNIAPILANKLSEYGLEKTIELHSKFRDRFKELCGSSDFVDRIASSIAVILVGAYTLEKVFDLGMHLDKIAKYFAKNIQGVTDTLDMANTAYERICEVVQANEKKFIHYVKRQSSDEEGYECWGRIIDRDSMSPKTKNNCPDVVAQIEILHDRFFKIVKDLGYSDVDIIIDKLKNSDYLYYEKLKHYRKRKLRKTDTKASHVIVLNVFDEENDDDTQGKEQSVRPVIKRAQHIRNKDTNTDTPMYEDNLCDDDNIDDWSFDWEEDED